MGSKTGSQGRGRAIYFFHEPSTDLPVRAMNDTRHKDEPYIEYGYEEGCNDGRVVGAENFCSACYQSAIRKVSENDEEFLFLVTYPKSGIEPKENHIVGYIRNEKILHPDGERRSICGEMKLFTFEDALPASEFGKRASGPLGKWGETYDTDQTEEILSHFDGCEDVTEECLEKTLKLKREDGEGENTTHDSQGC